MQVREAMSQRVHVCKRFESLQEAARRMWEHDVGALPVIDEDRRPIAMITDRDICMAAYTQGRPLREIPVSTAMSRRVVVCHDDDPLGNAENAMATAQVRRLPVVTHTGSLVGVLSLGDIVLAKTATPVNNAVERVPGDVTRTLAAISRRRVKAATPQRGA